MKELSLLSVVHRFSRRMFFSLCICSIALSAGWSQEEEKDKLIDNFRKLDSFSLGYLHPYYNGSFFYLDFLNNAFFGNSSTAVTSQSIWNINGSAGDGVSPFYNNTAIRDNTSQFGPNSNSSWILYLSPMAFFQRDRDLMIFSQDPLMDAHVFKSTDHQVPFAQAPKLLQANEQAPYRVVRRVRSLMGLGVAVGVASYFSSATPGLNFSVGLMPIKGRHCYSERSVANYNQAQTAPALSIPQDLAQMETWEKGDSLNFAQTGGILFNASVGSVGLRLGGNYLATGTWQTEIERLSGPFVYVRHSHEKLQNLSLVFSGIVVNASAGLFNGVDKGFAYKFNVRSALGRKALEKMLRGDISSVQKMLGTVGEESTDGRQDSIVHLENYNTAISGTTRAFRLGIPFIKFGHNRALSNIYTLTNADYFENGSQARVHHGLLLRTKETQRFRQQQENDVSFVGSLYEKVDKDGHRQLSYMGHFGHHYFAKHVSRNLLYSQMKMLVHKTSLRSELLVDVKGHNANGPLGAVDLMYLLSFDQEATDLLMNLAKNPETSDIFEKLALGFIKSYFSQVDKYDDRNLVCAGESYSACEKRMIRSSKNAIRAMKTHLLSMKDALPLQPKNFVSAYARFGQSLMYNPFAFQAVYNLVQGRGAFAEYVLQGEKIKKYHVRFRWDPKVVARKEK